MGSTAHFWVGTNGPVTYDSMKQVHEPGMTARGCGCVCMVQTVSVAVENSLAVDGSLAVRASLITDGFAVTLTLAIPKLSWPLPTCFPSCRTEYGARSERSPT